MATTTIESGVVLDLPDGFLSWTGGISPVDQDAVVQVAMVTLATPDGTPAFTIKTRNAPDVRWSWVGGGIGADIVGYREVTVAPQ